MQFRNAEEAVHWILGRYEWVPYDPNDPRLMLIQDTEEALRQQGEPKLILLAIREKGEPQSPETE